MKRSGNPLSVIAAYAFFSAGVIQAQSEAEWAARDYLKLNARITAESEFKYYDLIHSVFPNAKSDIINPQNNAAADSTAKIIRQRILPVE